MVNDFEKRIYNTYLIISRSIKNKPFSIRKDFSDLSETTELCLKKLQNLFNNYPHIDMTEYFKAPYLLLPDQEHFELSFFANYSGISAYTKYQKYKEALEPDDPLQLEYTGKSMKFIGSFCFKNKLKLEEYPYYKNDKTYCWMQHYKQHQINIYSLMEFKEIHDIINNTEEDVNELFLSDISKNYGMYRIKYSNSKQTKKLVTMAMEKIKKIIEK